ncbi:Serine/threonine kinase-like domain-containing protein STKLD1 [Oopsacas minuta]|uniref:non-specific serine/threonine protein kinase n=1 Tax=Oopsacas minuta TaxID=111878 RepID=A0AAV7JGL6_9METZ|nr:Serine/threonine kinase-like domain-containing protein STKLD1 [Oopsacas minuta]
MLKYRALSYLDKKSPTGPVSTPSVSRASCVYLVEEKKTKKQFVMRKIEVEDQIIADSADNQFNDVISFTTDKRVALYMECFITYSKLDSALFVCLIGEYCPGGSLEGLLADRRERGLTIGEGEIKKWYGQLLEGLEGMHREERVHRRIRSSNVFVRDGGLILGYIGLQIEEGDIKREYSSILPPEYRNKKTDTHHLSYSYDIWCFGILLLEICTINRICWKNIVQYLNREDIDIELNRVFDAIESNYSIEIVNVISSCLKLNPINRCNITYLCSLPFTQDCLSLISSPLLARIRSLETNHLPIPPSPPCPIQDIFQYMRDNTDIRQCQIIGLEKLLICVNYYSGKLNNSDKRFLRNILEHYFDIMLFQLSVVRLFVCSMKDIEDNSIDVLLTQPYVDIVARISLQQTDTTELFSISCVYLLLVSQYEDNPTIIANHGIIQHILSIVSHNSQDTVCISSVCSLLWSLTVIPDNLRAMTELNALKWTIDITKHFHDNPSILLPATNLLWSLFQDNINLAKAYYYDIVSICINSIHKHASSHELGVSILKLLVCVCGIESCAFQLLEDECSGLKILLEFMKKYFAHLSIAEKMIELMTVLFNFKDLKEELISLDLREILTNWVDEVDNPLLSEFIQKLVTEN